MMELIVNGWLIWLIVGALSIGVVSMYKKKPHPLMLMVIPVMVFGVVAIKVNNHEKVKVKNYEKIIQSVMSESYGIEGVAVKVHEDNGEYRKVSDGRFSKMFEREFKKLKLSNDYKKEAEKSHYEFQVLTQDGAYEVVPTNNSLMYVIFSDGESLQGRKAVLNALKSSELDSYKELTYDVSGRYIVIMDDESEYTVSMKEETVEKIVGKDGKTIYTSDEKQVDDEDKVSRQNPEGGIVNEE